MGAARPGPPRVNQHSFDTWLKPARAAGIRGKILYVTLPTPDFRSVPEKYGALIAEVLGNDLEVKFVIPEAVAC
jgi:chromosomal replication initiator protein